MAARFMFLRVADLRGEGCGDVKRSAAHRLIGLYDGSHGPLQNDDGELLLETTQLLKSIVDRVAPS